MVTTTALNANMPTMITATNVTQDNQSRRSFQANFLNKQQQNTNFYSWLSNKQGPISLKSTLHEFQVKYKITL